MYLIGLKKWLDHRVARFCYNYIFKTMAVSPGGVEYNPAYFSDSLLLLAKLREKIEELEEQSEQFRYLHELKKQINLLSMDTNQSIIQITALLTQIIVSLNSHVSEARYQYVSDQMRSNRSVNPEKLKMRLLEINQYKKQLQDFQTILLTKRNHLNEKIDNLSYRPLLDTPSVLMS